LTDRHQAPYVPFRCSKKTEATLTLPPELTKRYQKEREDICREAGDKAG